jgi:hypothetical protein
MRFHGRPEERQMMLPALPNIVPLEVWAILLKNSYDSAKEPASRLSRYEEG